MLLRKFKQFGQDEVSPQRRLPMSTNTAGAASTVSGETVSLYYFSSGVPTADAGQAAGTVVCGSFAKKGSILNYLNTSVGMWSDSSVTIGGTAFTRQKPFRGLLAELAEKGGVEGTFPLSTKATKVTEGFSRGDYCIDYTTGEIFGVKADTSTSVTADYAYFATASGGGGGAVTIADGDDVALGAKANSAASSDTGTFSLIALIKRGLQGLTTMNTSVGALYITGIGHGKKTVTTAGTDVALAASTACKRVIIEAYELNTGRIAVGGSGVDATQANGDGTTLGPKDTITLEIDNLADVYIDSTVNGEGVRFTYFT